MNINLTDTEVRLVLDLLRDQIIREKRNYEINPRDIIQLIIEQMKNLETKIKDIWKKNNK